NTRVENLNVDAELVHVLDARADVGEIARSDRGRHVAAELGRALRQLFLAVQEAKQAADLAVDHPMRPLAAVLRVKQLRREFVLRRRQILPGERAFDYMRIGVDPSHGLLRDQCSTAPPLTRMVWPVTNALKSDKRYSAVPTKSSGCSMRFKIRVDAER